MLDFSQEQDQSAIAGGSSFEPTPPGSIVKVRVELDDAGQYGVQGQHPCVSATKTGIYQTNFKLTRLSNGDEMRFQRVAWPVGAQPNKDNLTGNQKGLCTIGGAIMKAMLQVGGRGLAAEWEAFNGIECAVMLDCEWSKPNAQGKSFLNNNLYNPIEDGKKKLGRIAVLTPDHELFQQVMNGTDYISNNPIPERPAQAQPTQQQQYGAQQQQPWQGQQQAQQGIRPAWSQGGMDDVPF